MNVAILIPVLTVIYAITLQNLYKNMVQGSINFLKQESYNSQLYVMNYLESQDSLGVDMVMKNMSPFLSTYISGNTNCRTQIYGEEGILLGDSEDDSSFAKGEDVKNALSGNKSYVLRNINDKPYILFSSPIYKNNKTVGAIRYIYKLNNQTDILYKTFYVMMFVGLLALLAALTLSYLLAGNIAKPVQNLKNAAAKVAEGNFTKVIEINSNDEVEELAQTFNKMSESLSNYVERLKDEKEKQKRFLDNATHEFKTPLTAIIGYSDLLNRIEDKKDIEKCTFYIQKETKRLLNLVEELLKLSKLGKDDYKIKLQKVNIKSVVMEALTILKPRLDKYCININMNIFDEELYIDPLKTEQVILNIVDNAIKHSECSKINIEFIMEAPFFLIKIKDDGCGIDEENLKNVFEPFCSIDKKVESSGLGLSICKKIMSKQGGSIDIKSKDNFGTEVILKFNCYNSDANVK